MRTGFILGVVSFIPLVAFEWLRCCDFKKQKKRFNPLFWIGLILLVSGWGWMVHASVPSKMPQFAAGVTVTVLGCLSYVYVLVSVSSSGTYSENNGQSDVISTGIYGRMRHPGVWSFLLVSIGMGMAFPETLCEGLCFAALNLIYTILQDIWFFPVTLAGYGEYKKQVPFLVPKRERRN